MATDPDKKSTTSVKLDLLDAICRDPRVTPGEFRVAYVMAQHQGRKGICPSLELLEIETGIKSRQLRNLIDGLAAKGWLRKSRTNRHTTNQYEFVDANVEPINQLFHDRKDQLQIERMARLSERQNSAGRKGGDLQEIAGLDRQRIADPERQNIAGKHLERTPLVEHLSLRQEDELSSSDELREEADDEESPQGERVGGGFRAQHIAPGPSLLASPLMQPRSPRDSLDAMFGSDADFPGDRR